MQELPLWQSLRNALKPQILSYDRKPGRLSASISLPCLLVFLSQTVSEITKACNIYYHNNPGENLGLHPSSSPSKEEEFI